MGYIQVDFFERVSPHISQAAVLKLHHFKIGEELEKFIKCWYNLALNLKRFDLVELFLQVRRISDQLSCAWKVGRYFEKEFVDMLEFLTLG